MKIRVSDIPPRGLSIDDCIPLDALNERLQAGGGEEIVFLSPPRVKATFFRSPNGAESKGTISSRFRQACCVCSEPIERDVELEANFIFKEKPQAVVGSEDEMFEDDIGIYHFENDHIELEHIVQEALILSLSIFWRPAEDDQGHCRICGKTSSEVCAKLVSVNGGGVTIGEKPGKGQKLGDLFSSARSPTKSEK